MFEESLIYSQLRGPKPRCPLQQSTLIDFSTSFTALCFLLMWRPKSQQNNEQRLHRGILSIQTCLYSACSMRKILNISDDRLRHSLVVGRGWCLPTHPSSSPHACNFGDVVPLLSKIPRGPSHVGNQYSTLDWPVGWKNFTASSQAHT
jgi:hypothetical protein